MQAIIRVVRWLLIGAAVGYCFGIVALALLWSTGAQQIWWLALSNVFALYLFVPLLLLVPLALALRSRWLRGAVTSTLIVFLVLFGGHLIPPPDRSPAGTSLRVVTFNHLYSNQRVGDIVAAIRAQDADVVALQELSGPVAQALREQLGEMYPYQFLVAAEADYGLGILSRYPLQNETLEERFVGQRVTVNLDGQAITFINVDLSAPSVNIRRLRSLRSVRLIRGYNTSQRASEFPALLSAIDQAEGPLVVLGDFNTSDRELPYDQLAARLHDAYRETAWGFGFTFPNNKRMGSLTIPFPLVRIDYVWSRGGVLPAGARVECASGGSDHCMVVAHLRVGGDTQAPAGENAEIAPELVPARVGELLTGSVGCPSEMARREEVASLPMNCVSRMSKGGGAPW